MEFQEILRRRYSCRSYADRPVEREKIISCLEAGRISPSGCNTQRWKFVAVDDPALCSKMAGAMQAPPDIGINTFTYDIPAFIAVLRHPPRRELNEKQKKIIGQFDHQDIDIGIAAQQICLAATDLGLGSIMLGWFDEQAIKDILSVPQNLSVALVIGLGYPKTETVRKPGRYSPEQIYSWNGYQE